jgi:ribose 5-phosphate isomerase B
MRIYVGADHAGFQLKQELVRRLTEGGHEVNAVGAARLDPEDDYSPYCLNAAARVVADPGSLGVVIGGSGNGEQIAANKVPGVRAALVWNRDTARLAREHNDANVVAIGARMHSVDDACALVSIFVGTAFTGSERHLRRIGEITRYEETHTLPPLA